jgi:large subunit ribosomal protein L24e
MVKCTFCGNAIEIGTGLKYVKDDGREYDFCCSKCKKNQLKLKRNPLHIKWTKRFTKK